MALAGPEVFPAAAGPPAGLHRLVFGDSRPFDQHELRRLAPAAVVSRTLIGATVDRDRGPRIWGLIHSGAHWLQSVRGGRETHAAVDARFRAVLACHILRRVFATVRGAQHGGMLILVPEQTSQQLLSAGDHIWEISVRGGGATASAADVDRGDHPPTRRRASGAC